MLMIARRVSGPPIDLSIRDNKPVAGYAVFNKGLGLVSQVANGNENVNASGYVRAVQKKRAVDELDSSLPIRDGVPILGLDVVRARFRVDQHNRAGCVVNKAIVIARVLRESRAAK